MIGYPNNDRDRRILRLKIKRELARRLPAWEPMKDPDAPDTPLPQEIAFNCTAQYIGYGGAAGGGKTDLALGSALMKHERSIIFRVDRTQFENITNRLDEIIGPEYLNRSNWICKPPTGERKITAKSITLAHLQHPKKDWKKHAGNPRDLIVFDEAIEFPADIIHLLMAWNRSASGHFCQTILTFNPPIDTIGTWIIDEFGPWHNPQHRLYPQESGTILHYARIDGQPVWTLESGPFTEHPYTGEKLDGEIETMTGTFIRAHVHDNIYFRGQDYEKKLKGLSGKFRKALYEGDMLAALESSPDICVQPADYQRAVDRWNAHERLKDNPNVIGADVHRGGSDASILAPFWDDYCGILRKRTGKAIKDGDDVTKFIRAEFGLTSAEIAIDSIGIGASAFDSVKKVFANVHQFMGSHKTHLRTADRRYGFNNIIQAGYYLIGQELANPESTLCLPPDSELRRQLTSRRITKIHNGKIHIETKEAFSKRLGNSPNEADAVVMAWLRQNAPSSKTLESLIGVH